MVPVWFSDSLAAILPIFLMMIWEWLSSVLVFAMPHIGVLSCSYLFRTYSNSPTYNQVCWSEHETQLWLFYLFHWFVLCFALSFPYSGHPTLLYIRLCIPIWGNQVMPSPHIAHECRGWIKLLQVVWACTEILNGGDFWVYSEWLYGWGSVFVSYDVSWSYDVWDRFPDVCHFSFQTVRQVQFNRAEEIAKSVISDETKIKRIALERC